MPLTYTLLRPTQDQDALAPRIQTDYKIEHAATVDSLKSAHKRKQWRVKRVLFVVAGWAIMGAMAYLIMVTKQNIPKIWNPYDILGVQEVRTGQTYTLVFSRISSGLWAVANVDETIELYREANQVALQAPFREIPPRQGST